MMRRSEREERAERFASLARTWTWLPINLPLLLWTVTGITVTVLSLRFGMRAVGVRDDIPLPDRIYSLTAHLVEPFYPLFPVSDRFDYPAIEVASLAAVGVVLALTLLVYMAGLIVASARPNIDS
jgi:hypothetical protein